MIQSRRGWALVELLAAIVLIVLAVAVSIPAFGRASRHAKLEACRGNLRTLHQASEAYYKDRRELQAKTRGRAYWTSFKDAVPPVVAPGAYLCPLAEVTAPPPTQYLGPARDASTMAPDQVLGCDDGTNHSPNGGMGGNILLKSGKVVTDDGLKSDESTPGGGPLWRQSLLKYCTN